MSAPAESAPAAEMTIDCGRALPPERAPLPPAAALSSSSEAEAMGLAMGLLEVSPRSPISLDSSDRTFSCGTGRARGMLLGRAAGLARGRCRLQLHRSTEASTARSVTGVALLAATPSAGTLRI